MKLGFEVEYWLQIKGLQDLAREAELFKVCLFLKGRIIMSHGMDGLG